MRHDETCSWNASGDLNIPWLAQASSLVVASVGRIRERRKMIGTRPTVTFTEEYVHLLQ